MLSLDLGTGMGISCGFQGFPCADQSESLLVVVGSPVSAQRVVFVRRGDLEDVVLAVLLLLDCINQLVVSDEPRWCCPLSSCQLGDVRPLSVSVCSIDCCFFPRCGRVQSGVVIAGWFWQSVMAFANLVAGLCWRHAC